jgi:hypothetical protein
MNLSVEEEREKNKTTVHLSLSPSQTLLLSFGLSPLLCLSPIESERETERDGEVSWH